MEPDDFSGGMEPAQAGGVLQRLGFEVIQKLDAAVRDHGLDPDGSWWVEAEKNGAEDQLQELLESVTAGFEDF